MSTNYLQYMLSGQRTRCLQKITIIIDSGRSHARKGVATGAKNRLFRVIHNNIIADYAGRAYPYLMVNTTCVILSDNVSIHKDISRVIIHMNAAAVVVLNRVASNYRA